jgi:ribosomal RNA assembly protein
MEFLRIPSDRVAVLVGKGGSVKKSIEERCRVRLDVERDGGVRISGEATDEWRAKGVIKAIGRGFNPAVAFKLLSDEYYLEVIELREIFGSEKTIERYKGRVIGKEGKARRFIEEMTGTHVSVFGDTIAIIGALEDAALAKAAIRMLLEGAAHSGVYHFLERQKSKRKEEEYSLWQKKR